MRKILTLATFLALAGCADQAVIFVEHQWANARVAKNSSDKCMVLINITSSSYARPDIAITARIQSPECTK